MPMARVYGLYPLASVLPIVAVEWVVYRLREGPTWRRWFFRVAAANAVSAMVGIPFAFLMYYLSLEVEWINVTPLVVTVPFYILSVYVEQMVMVREAEHAGQTPPRFSTAWLANGVSYAGLVAFWLVMVGW